MYMYVCKYVFIHLYMYTSSPAADTALLATLLPQVYTYKHIYIYIFR